MSEPNIPNLPGMGNAPTMQAQLSTVTGRVLLYCDRAVDGLTVDQLCDTRGGVTLLNQRSGSPCSQGSTWGYDQRGIWVDRGCRADFRLGR